MPERRSGHPDYAAPYEPPEIEIVGVEVDGNVLGLLLNAADTLATIQLQAEADARQVLNEKVPA